MPRKQIVGLISDTHGLLRPEALDLLQGCDCIVHAGDIGNPGIVAELARIAPVTAVRGNVDRAAWAQSIPETQVLHIGKAVRLYVLHDIEDLGFDPAAAGFQAVVYGHSHRPESWRKDGVLYVNPGSAGPRRFSLPISVARLVADAGTLSVDLMRIAPK